MDCIKCGQQTQGKNVFCAACLADMEKYPVRQDTPVILPNRNAAVRKTPQRKSPKAEELVLQLQRKMKRLWICIAVLSLLLTGVLGALVVLIFRQNEEADLGSNYSTFSSVDTTAESSE